MLVQSQDISKTKDGPVSELHIGVDGAKGFDEGFDDLSETDDDDDPDDDPDNDPFADC